MIQPLGASVRDILKVPFNTSVSVFPTLFYTSACEIPTLLYTSSQKKVSLSGGASRIVHYREYLPLPEPTASMFQTGYGVGGGGGGGEWRREKQGLGPRNDILGNLQGDPLVSDF